MTPAGWSALTKYEFSVSPSLVNSLTRSHFLMWKSSGVGTSVRAPSGRYRG